MRPSRADVFPMLVIMAGGAIGALLTLSPVLLFGPIDDVLAPVPVLSPPEEAPAVARPVRGRAVRVWSSNGTSVVYEDANGNVYRTDSGGGVPEAVQFSPDGQWILYSAGVRPSLNGPPRPWRAWRSRDVEQASSLRRVVPQ